MAKACDGKDWLSPGDPLRSRPSPGTRRGGIVEVIGGRGYREVGGIVELVGRRFESMGSGPKMCGASRRIGGRSEEDRELE